MPDIFDPDRMKEVSERCKTRLVLLLESNHSKLDIVLDEEDHKQVTWIIHCALCQIAEDTLSKLAILNNDVEGYRKIFESLKLVLEHWQIMLLGHHEALIVNGLIEPIKNGGDDSEGSHSLEDLLKDLENPPDPPDNEES